jgi:hypothetical protein
LGLYLGLAFWESFVTGSTRYVLELAFVFLSRLVFFFGFCLVTEKMEESDGKQNQNGGEVNSAKTTFL